MRSRVINAICRMLVELIVRLHRSRFVQGSTRLHQDCQFSKESEVAASVRRHAGFDDTQGSEAVDPGRVRSVGEHGGPSLVSNNREAIAPPEKVSL